MQARKLIAGLLLALAMAGCQSETRIDGKEVKCYGLAGDPQPGYKYHVSTWNLIVGAVTFSTTVFPIWIAAERLYCPTHKLPTQELPEIKP